MVRLFIIVFVSIIICGLDTAPTIKYSNGCSVLERSQSDQSCSGATKCYSFTTTRNTTICAPQVTCSLFETCINNSRACITNTSMCVTNSCCDRPICIPLALAQTCTVSSSSEVRANVSSTWAGRLCPNATWNNNPVAVTPDYVNQSYIGTDDFFLDNESNIILLDSYNRRIIRIDMTNHSNITFLVGISNLFNLWSLYMVVDVNGSAYLTESYSINSPSYQVYYQITRYEFNGNTNSSGTIIYGPFTCGSGLSELCYAGGFIRDSLGSFYYSDSQNHRVLKLQPFATSATVVAGISGVSGSALNQFNSPGALALDSENNLYVSDFGNFRLLKFTRGSTTGIVLLTTTLYQSVTGLLIDFGGSLFAVANSNLFRWSQELNGFVSVMALTNYLGSRIRMDNQGNIYNLLNSGSNAIYKYRLVSNCC